MALLTIGLMYASFIGIGWLASRRQAAGTADDFMVAGRAMPLWLATFTMTATWVDGGYLLGTAEGVYRASLASGLQGGVCFGISLIIGGLFFARRMRALEFHTLIDPFEARFGAKWAVVLALPAVLAEMFWSAELLVALGSTFGVVLDLNLTTGIVISAAVVTLYTMAGGMWAVAYTDEFQLLLVGIGLAAVVGGETSSFSSSFLSAGSMFAWNVYRRLLRPDMSVSGLTRVMRLAIALLGVGAVLMALKVQSVQALWFFTSDLVFVLLFPQLVSALFDSKANVIGSMAAFAVSLILRLGGGEPLFGMPALIAYPEWWPFKTVAAAAGLVLLPLVSRVTGAAAPPIPLPTPGDPEAL